MKITFYESLGEDSYTIKTVLHQDGWQYFLQNEEGEGMGLSEKSLYDILDVFFKENF